MNELQREILKLTGSQQWRRSLQTRNEFAAPASDKRFDDLLEKLNNAHNDDDDPWQT